MSKQEMKVTSLDDLKGFKDGMIVRLPPFGEGQEFVAKLRRPSLMNLIKIGKIPNSLMKTATELFTGKNNYGMLTKEDSLKDVFDVLDTICDACFVEPSYKEIKEAGIQLTDDQIMFIFNYTQTGVKALEPFRK